MVIINLSHVFLQSFLLILTLQVIFFLIAFILKTDIFTDLVYSLTFIISTLWQLISNKSFFCPQIFLTVLVTVWGLRLGGYLFIRILKTKKDARFNKIRQSFFKLAGFWILQAITIFLVLLPVFVVLKSNQEKFSPLMFLGSLIWLTGFLLETVADWQKFQFKSKKENRDHWVNVGVWKHSRHPNYLGEMLCWWGIYVYSLPFLKGWEYLTIISPLFISLMLRFVSGIPILEKSHDKKYGNSSEYQNYKKKTNLLIPFPNRFKWV